MSEKGFILSMIRGDYPSNASAVSLSFEGHEQTGYFIKYGLQGWEYKLPFPWQCTPLDNSCLKLSADQQSVTICSDEFNDLSTPYKIPCYKGLWLYLARWQGSSCGLVAAGSGAVLHSWAEVQGCDWLSIPYPWYGMQPVPGQLAKTWQFFGASHVTASLRLEESYLYSISSQSVAEVDLAATLIFTRIAYPKFALELTEIPEKWQPLWKRLCQNLGILCGKAPRPDLPQHPLHLSWAKFPREQLQSLLIQVNSQAPIVPERLWRSLIECP